MTTPPAITEDYRLFCLEPGTSERTRAAAALAEYDEKISGIPDCTTVSLSCATLSTTPDTGAVTVQSSVDPSMPSL